MANEDAEKRISGEPETENERGTLRSQISNHMVQLHKEFYGRGPDKAKTYIQDDTVVVIMRGGFTKVEQTLLDHGEGHAVIQQRMKFQEVMKKAFTDAIEEVTGRKVVAFMSGSHQKPDVSAEVFLLDPTDVLE